MEEASYFSVVGGGGAPGADSSVLLPPQVNSGGEDSRQVAGKGGLGGRTAAHNTNAACELTALASPQKSEMEMGGGGARRSLPRRTSALLTRQNGPRRPQPGRRSRRGPRERAGAAPSTRCARSPSRGPRRAPRRGRPAIFPCRPSGRRSTARSSGGARSPPGRGRSPAAAHRLRPGAGVRGRAPMQSPHGGRTQSIWPSPLGGSHGQEPRPGRGGSVAFLGRPGEWLAEPLKHVRRRAAGPHAHPATSAGPLRPLPPAVPSSPPTQQPLDAGAQLSVPTRL